jgi:hypothetical protein
LAPQSTLRFSVSVTSHIHDRGSPVRGFFERELPDTRAAVAEANNALRGGLDEPPLSGLGHASLVATAADVLLNAWTARHGIVQRAQPTARRRH